MGVRYTRGKGLEDVPGVETPSNRFKGGPKPISNREDEGCYHVDLLSDLGECLKDRLRQHCRQREHAEGSQIPDSDRQGLVRLEGENNGEENRERRSCYPSGQDHRGGSRAEEEC
jgi:hypothetical protein